jgi:UTP--glucose-1-phosphate uridylyltransferase
VTLDVSQIAAEADTQLAQLGDLGLHVDAERLERFARALAAGELGPSSNWFARDPEPAGPDDVEPLDGLVPPERARLERLGCEALERGELAVAVLNGGMATRFGGGVKGVVEAIAGRSFLEIKHAQARARGAPFLIMNSFATHSLTLAHLRERGLEANAFLQNASVRLTPGGDAFRDEAGQLSLYAPGHGDFPEALRRSGALDELRSRGVRAVMLSNVDNLGAEPDSLVLGYHLDHARPLTCEVASVVPGDAGGTPAFVDGRLVVVEGFRFSPQFDFSALHFLSTNTFLFSLDLLARDEPLTWFYVEKSVAGRTAVQMERLVNELSSFVPTAFVATPRSGPRGRFLPIKSREDLAALQADAALVERFGSV